MPPVHSIIVPVYNAAPWLAQCLDSIAAQRAGDWECICVDDGSTDGSGAILDGYAKRDARFRVVHAENRGPGAARNAGLDLARGEWISFVDSDDMVRPDYFSAFDALPVKADVVFFQVSTIDENGIRRNVTFPSDFPAEPVEDAEGVFRLACGLILNDRRTDMFGWTCNKFLRHELLRDATIRFDASVRCYEDELFALSVLAKARSVGILPRCLYNYRLRPDGLTSRREENKAGLAAAYDRALDAFSDPSFLSLQSERLFFLFEESFLESPSARSLDRFLSFFRKRRRRLRFADRGKRLRTELAASPVFRPLRKFPCAVRSFLGGKPSFFWTPPGEKNPVEIATFFV